MILTDGLLRVGAFDPPVEAIAVGGGQVLAAGPLEAARAAAPAARLVRLDGAAVVPGLVESHVHAVYYGLTQRWADCRSPRNAGIGDIQARLRDAMGGLRPGQWLRGWGYDDTLLAEARHLDAADLDAVSSETPIVVTHISGHFLAANSAALRLSGVDDTTPDPREGHIARDRRGRATGLMCELGAVTLVLNAVPPASDADLRSAALAATEAAARRGMTTIHDLSVGLPDLGVWQGLDDAGSLPIRVKGYLRGDRVDALGDGFRFPSAGDRFALLGAKLWADGSIQGLSAALLAPYSCADHTGELQLDVPELVDLISGVEERGGQCAVHANGDRAIAAVVEALASVRRGHPRGDVRHRVEHMQLAHRDHLRDLAALDHGASFFANHVRYWGDRHRDVFLGRERAERIDPGADAVAHGLHFGLHSDCPVTPMDALATMGTAVTRRTSGGEVLGPAQALTPAQALHALTADSAWLAGAEHRTGRLLPGMDADLVVLDRDPLTCDPETIADAEVLRTMVGGRWV